MKRKNIFDDVDFDTAKKIADEYPSLTKKERDRIFSSATKKASIEYESSNANEIKVDGVERYKKPKMSRFVVAAASFVIAAAGIGGTGILFRNMDANPPEPALSSDIESETQAVTEPAEPDEHKTEYEKAAYRVTDEYFTLGRYIYAGGFEYKDTNGLPPDDSSIELNYSYTHPESGIEETGSQTYYPVIDEKFPDMEAFKEYYYSYRMAGYTVYGDDLELEDVLFGGDVTDADIASPETLGEKLLDEDGRFYEYININGELYMLDYPIVEGIEAISAMSWVYEPVISDVTENSFTATRKYISVEGELMAYVTVAFEIVWDEEAQDWRAASERYTGEPIEQGD